MLKVSTGIEFHDTLARATTIYIKHLSWSLWTAWINDSVTAYAIFRIMLLLIAINLLALMKQQISQIMPSIRSSFIDQSTTSSFTTFVYYKLIRIFLLYDTLTMQSCINTEQFMLPAGRLTRQRFDFLGNPNSRCNRASLEEDEPHCELWSLKTRWVLSPQTLLKDYKQHLRSLIPLLISVNL